MSATDTAPDRPTLAEIVEELVDLTAGLGVMLLPLLILAVPGIILFVVLPGLLLLAVAAPVAVLGAVILAPPYLIVRFFRRRRSRPQTAPAAAVRIPA
jgi:hypothetical protein